MPTDSCSSRMTSGARPIFGLKRCSEGETVPLPPFPGRRANGSDAVLIEQAKGALMLCYGVDSYQAFAVLVRWARVTREPVRTVAHALLHGICEGSSQTEVRQRPLIRWLEAQLRDGDPDLAPLRVRPGWPRAGT
jgi:hypothetical protein